jgi:hypothetical protein
VSLYIDLPTRAQIERLLTSRYPASVSVYLPTDPASQGQAERIELKNLATEAERQLGELGAPRSDVTETAAAFSDLLDDDTFWRYQARSLCVFVRPDTLRTFRLPNHLVSMVEVSDRFHLKPLLRAVTFPQVAFVLALAEDSVRLIEVAADLAPWEVKVPDLPASAAAAVRQSSIKGRGPRRKIQGSEGQKVRLRQYSRQIDHALRPVLNGLDIPLILAATEPIDAIFRSSCSYPYLAAVGIPGSPGATSDAGLSARARTVLHELNADELRKLRALYDDRRSYGRTAEDLADVARAATMGAVEAVFVDIDEVIPGSIDERTGAVAFSPSADAASYGVVDEIARRVWLSGGRVLAVRRDDVPGGNSVAAILRYAPS